MRLTNQSVLHRWGGVVLFAIFLWTGLGQAAERQPTQDKRLVLGLFDSSEPYSRTADISNVHKYLAMPLTRLGMVMDYADANQRPLPDPSRYRAIVIWFADAKIAKPVEVCEWLLNAMEGGTKVILFDGIRFAQQDLAGKPTPVAVLEKVRRAYGTRINTTIDETGNPFLLKMEFPVPDGFHFEINQPVGEFSYRCDQPVTPDVRAWKTCLRTDIADSQSILVSTSPRGGWISNPDHVIHLFPGEIYRAFWDLNPFSFLQEALDCKETLRPDITTAFGARAAFSHIDSDGMVNVALDVPGPKRLSAEVIYDEILCTYPVPVTVGLIVGRVDPQAAGDAKNLPLWRRIMARPNVQPGCHAYSHPLNWAKGIMAIPIPGHPTFSERFETIDAMEYLRKNILPDGKRVEVNLWTGNCAPNASAIRLVRNEYGVLDMNGGDPQLDGNTNSVTFIPAPTRPVGDTYQVFAAASNEYIYTNRWSENYGGFINVLETYKRTDTPRRLLPVNVYYHCYSGERIAALNALRTVYDWTLEQPLCWLHAAEYVRSVHAQRTAHTGRTSDGGYWVENYDHLLTVRLDNTTVGVDMQTAKNVLGFTHHAGSLYVSLAPGKRAEFRLTATPAATPCLCESTSYLKDVQAGKMTWQAQARLYAPGRILLQGFAPKAKRKVQVGKTSTVVQADADGRIHIAMPKGWGDWVEVTVGP